MSKASDAKKFFVENAGMFDLKSEPEKYNFYNGLALLADAIDNIKSEVFEVKMDTERIIKGLK